MKITRVLCAGLLCFGVAHAQESPEESCSAISELYEAGDIDGALEEARWCVEALEQIKQGEVGAVFSDEVMGWTRESLEQTDAMGMSVTEARYTQEDKTISVTLMGNTGGGDMGLFGGLAQMGMMSAGNKFRIDRRTAVANSEGGTSTVIVSLDSGGSLTFESYDADIDTVTEFAKAFPIADLDEARGG
jgi:hypothetical protein